MVDGLQLRNAIAEIVGSDVGYYQIGTAQVPAIMMVPPEPRATWKPHGLEVIIDRIAWTKDYGSNGGLRRTQKWRVILNQWNREDHDTLARVQNQILQEFVGLATYFYQPQTDYYYERSNISIQLQNYIKR